MGTSSKINNGRKHASTLRKPLHMTPSMFHHHDGLRLVSVEEDEEEAIALWSQLTDVFPVPLITRVRDACAICVVMDVSSPQTFVMMFIKTVSKAHAMDVTRDLYAHTFYCFATSCTAEFPSCSTCNVVLTSE